MYDILRNLLQDHKGDIIFKCFGIWHILIMAVIFLGIGLTIILLKNKPYEIKQKAIKISINKFIEFFFTYTYFTINLGLNKSSSC